MNRITRLLPVVIALISLLAAQPVWAQLVGSSPEPEPTFTPASSNNQIDLLLAPRAPTETATYLLLSIESSLTDPQLLDGSQTQIMPQYAPVATPAPLPIALYPGVMVFTAASFLLLFFAFLLLAYRRQVVPLTATR